MQPTTSKSIRLSFVLAIIFTLTTAAAAAGFVWAFMEREHYRNDVESIVADAKQVAREEQSEADEARFIEEAKLPNRTFVGPSDLGGVSFNYPKTWAAHTAKSDSNNLNTYFYPSVVPPISSDAVYALRVVINNKAYDAVLKSYDNQVNKGELTATPIRTAIDGHAGMRLDGAVGKNLNGSLVIFKVRDKTLIVQVDTADFVGDFNNTILPTLTFVP